MKDLVSKIAACDLSKPFVFVSYSKRDAERVYPFILRLQGLGCNLWIDRELTKMVGQNWQFGAMRAMTDTNCRGILFMISEESLKSAPVFAELALSQKSKKVLRKHGGSGIKIIPINADRTWSQSKVGLATWIGRTVSLDAEKLTEDDYACLDIGGILHDYIAEDSMSRLDERGEIAQAILDDIFEPLGGGKITVASIEDMETVRENIDEACFCRPVVPVSAPEPEDPAPKRTVEPAGEAPKAVPVTPKAEAQDRQTAEGSVITYPNGDVYEGELRDGLRCGRGRMIYASGDVYVGMWKDDLRDGAGTTTYAGGDVYQGEYRADKRHGRGKYIFTNGNVYEGDYCDNKRQGFGVFRYANGEVYEGEFENGKRCGRGKYIFANGEVREGNWRDNKPV